MSTHLFVLLETFWRLSLAAPHVETDRLCLGASALAQSFSAFCLRIGSLQSPACCPDTAVWGGTGAKASCLITVKCPVCVTQHWYSTHDKWPHPLRFEGVSGKEKGEAFTIFPSHFGITSSMSRSFCSARDLFGFSGDEMCTNTQRNSHSHFIAEALPPLRSFEFDPLIQWQQKIYKALRRIFKNYFIFIISFRRAVFL